MEQFKTIFPSVFAFLFFLSVNTTAQYIQVVDTSNAFTSAQEIKAKFGSKIGVTTNEIKNFYLQHWGTGQTYSSSCQHPSAEITDISFPNASFGWNSIPVSSLGDNFLVSYLRLSDGISVTTTTGNPYITLNIPNDLFLIVFQTKCANTRSALDIIIVEKPIDIQFNERGCNCQEYNLVWSSPSALNNSSLVSYNWENTNPTERYYCYVKLLEGPSASFIADINFGGEGPKIASFDTTCMTNINITPDTSFISMHKPDDTAIEYGVFGFFDNIVEGGTPQFSFNLTSGSPYNLDKIDLYKCAGMLSGGGFRQNKTVKTQNKISLKSFPNPSKTYTKFEYNLPEQERISIEVFNAYGKLIKTLKDQVLTEAGTHQLEFDLTDLADGIYICVLRTQEDTLYSKFFKTH